ncbi:MAG: hypothetical protein AMJ79_02570 [Phycisphaerae bacterium SM23_30]|nr:MAG: hypothetical protein AMJ79_02570 [Phycisphaerae bacterium SM23_30]
MPSAVRPTNVARVSMLMQTDLLMNSIRTNSVDLLKVQNQLATGLKLARPSDSPGEATTIMHLDSSLERHEQYLRNTEFADGFLAATDSALGQAVALVQEAYSLALESIGMGADDAGRASNAQMVDQIIKQLVTISNTEYRGSYIFAGHNGTEMPFTLSDGGVLFSGSLTEMQTRVADDSQVDFSVDADETFGALSQRIVGIEDLNPDVTADTLLSDLNGYLDQGIRRGGITISDGINSDTIDLSDCVTLGDVINKINNVTPATTTAALNAAADGLQITSTLGGANVTVVEVGSGTMARDLGIFDNTGSGATLTGQDVDARLTPATPVTALAGGAGIDNISGLRITNSLVGDVGVINIAAARTMEDILNAVNNAGIGVRAVINAGGTGINVYNLLSGSEMRIGENGGTTATDLGIRSLHDATPLSQLNYGRGVHTEPGQNDIEVYVDGASAFSVNLDSATTIQDVINLINAAAVAAGVPNIQADLASVGNGIEITDSLSAATGLQIITHPDNQSGYFTARELGLDKSVGGPTLTGDDVNAVKPQGLFTNLLTLRDAMLSNDNSAISNAAGVVEQDRQELSNMRGRVGSQMRALQDRRNQIEDHMIAMRTLRSDIQDIDFTEAITRYQNLYTALQGNLITGSQLTNVSLLDFLS